MTQASKNIWITGAGSGIGQELAKSLADAGHNVVITGRSLDKLEDTKSHNPSRILPLPWDVSDADSIDEIRGQLEAMVSHLDCVILNAGTCHYIDIDNINLESFHQDMNTNFFGFVHGFQAAVD